MIPHWIPVLGSKEPENDELPPKPDDEQREKEITLEVQEVEIEYRNGESETWRTYGEYRNTGHEVVYNITPYEYVRHHGDTPKPRYRFERETFHYEVLNREPIVSNVLCEDTYRMTWEVTHELKYEGWRTKETQWVEKIENLEMERVN